MAAEGQISQVKKDDERKMPSDEEAHGKAHVNLNARRYDSRL